MGTDGIEVGSKAGRIRGMFGDGRHGVEKKK